MSRSKEHSSGGKLLESLYLLSVEAENYIYTSQSVSTFKLTTITK